MGQTLRALDRYVRSAGYDAAAGRVNRVAMFQNEDYLKQLVLSVIQEVENQFSSNADK